MRKRSKGLVLVACLLLAGAARAAGEARGASGTGETVNRTVLAKLTVEDVPGHELVQSVGFDEVSTPDPIAGVSFADARMRTHNQSDLVDGSGLVRGYGVWEAGSGEKLFLVYGYKVPPRSPSSGDTVPFEGSFEWIGGTGRLENVRGNGTLQGQMAPDGRASYRWNGTYRLMSQP